MSQVKSIRRDVLRLKLSSVEAEAALRRQLQQTSKAAIDDLGRIGCLPAFLEATAEDGTETRSSGLYAWFELTSCIKDL